MHPVFFLDEIFKIICENVADSSRRGLAALAALAQTCRALEGISLDVLWSQVPFNFITVLKTLPPDSWSCIECPFCLNRPITPNELARFKQYTTRVRTLYVETPRTWEKATWTNQTFKTLIGPHKSFNWLSMWPKLKVLHWMTTRDHLPFLQYFLTLNVRNLKIRLEGAEDVEVQKALGLVESRCMNLEDLHLFDPGTREDKEIQDTIRQIVYNNSLTLRMFRPPQDPSVALVNDILRLPVLQVLVMHVPKIPVPAPRGIIPSLRSITFTLDEATDVIDLLGTLRRSRIRHFSLTCPYPTSEDDHLAIADFFGYTGLSSSVQVFSWEPYDWGVPAGRFATSLSGFSNMRTLHLGTSHGHSCQFAFCHHNIVQISMWMPRLRELNLGGSPCKRDGVTDVGYHTFAALAKNCPNLVLITLHFIPVTFISYYLPEPNWNVAVWNVGGTPLPKYDAPFLTLFAMTVAKLFPRVTFAGMEPANALEWSIIYEELQMLTLPAYHGLLNLM